MNLGLNMKGMLMHRPAVVTHIESNLVDIVTYVVILEAFFFLPRSWSARSWRRLWWARVLLFIHYRTLTAGCNSYVINPVLFIPLVESPAHGIHVRVLLHTSAQVAEAWVNELTVLVLDLRVAQSLVECLREVGVMVELEHEALRVDPHGTLRQLAHGRAAVKAWVGVKQSVVAEIRLRSG